MQTLFDMLQTIRENYSTKIKEAVLRVEEYFERYSISHRGELSKWYTSHGLFVEATVARTRRNELVHNEADR